MSIINDALKKAEEDKQPAPHKAQRIFSKIDEIKIGAEKYVLKRWLIWTSTGVACLLGVLLVTNYFKHSADSVLVGKGAPAPEVSSSAFHLREVDFEHAVKTSEFDLSGILYDEQRPLAIINERIVGEGALINGAKLLEIQSNYVKLSLDGEEFTLKIK